ncbi:MAG: FliM/FliN family flagellar motor switch protein [Planctomycetota bacterium]
MPEDARTLLKLEVPIVVRLAERDMPVGEVLHLTPGAIIELPKNADEELELFANNRRIGFGSAVKVGENFGIQISAIGAKTERVLAAVEEEDAGPSDEELAEALLSGQL